jgi:hypothetical protein
MVYGRQPKLPLDICLPSETEPIELDHEAYVKELKERLALMFNCVKQNTETTIDKTKIAYDRKVRCSSYVIGDKVWLLNSEKKKGSSPKLAKAWKGPYVVIDKIGPVNYKIKMPNAKKRTIVHVNRLKKCFSRTTENDQHEIVRSQNVDATQVDTPSDANPFTNTPQSALEPSEPVNTCVRHDADATAQVVELEQPRERPHEDEVSKAASIVKAKRGRPRKDKAPTVVIQRGTATRIQPERKVKRN